MDILERIVNLSQAGQCFAVATVVSRKAPVSSHLGDKAIILEEGTLEGFIGGACSREIVRKQALIALELQQPRLVRISPDTTQEATSPDEICVPMTCASEGAVDVYIEPHMERKRMVVVGASPIARALIQQTALQGFDVTAICEADERHGLVGLEDSAQIINLIDLAEFEAWLSALSKQQKGSLEAVVASMGHYDEETLALLVKANIRYLGLVSSQKRGQTVMALLADMELPATELARVHNPAGLDLGAKTPNEVALSIVAQIVQLRRQDVEAAKAARAALTSPTKSSCCSSSNKNEPTEAIDPICNMTVDIATAKHIGEHDGTTYYFCCPNCKLKFLKEPDKYLKAA